MPILTDAHRRLESRGVTLPDTPDHDLPQLPDDPTVMSDRDLMVIYSRFVGWIGYYATLVAEAEIMERDRETFLDQLKSQTLGSALQMDTRSTVAAKMVMIDPQVVQAQKELNKAYEDRKLALVAYGNAERSVQALSRELTRRVNMDTHHARDHKWGGG